MLLKTCFLTLRSGAAPTGRALREVVVVNAETKKTVSRRLASAAGHLNGIERMVSEDAHCMDTIQQIRAVTAALHKVNAIILDAHLHDCISGVVDGNSREDRERLLQEMTGVFTVVSKC